MSFWLTAEESEVSRLSCSEDKKDFLSNELVISICKFDNCDVSTNMMKTANDICLNKFSYNLKLFTSKRLDSGKRRLTLYTKWKLEKQALSLRLEGHILKILDDLYGDKVEVRIVLTGIQIRNNEEHLDWLDFNTSSTKAMKISLSNNNAHASRINGHYSSICYEAGVCEDDVVKFGVDLYSEMPLEVYAKIRVEVAIYGFNPLIFPSGKVPETMSRINKEMLDEEIHADVKIIVANGKEIKAHRSFLSVQSPVFKAMFRTECKEGLTRTVKIPEMSEETMKALLAYLYYGDLAEAEKSSELAFELFEAGHQYQIKPLEDCTKQILLQKPRNWIAIGIALRIFILARNMEECDDLKTMSIQVMKL